MDLHRLAEERRIAFHRAVAARMGQDGEVLRRARARVEGWLEAGEPHPVYAREWARILTLPMAELVDALVDPSEDARALRQVTPFAGALPPKERAEIWRRFERMHALRP
jgi:hypothetical protein